MTNIEAPWFVGGGSNGAAHTRGDDRHAENCGCRDRGAAGERGRTRGCVRCARAGTVHKQCTCYNTATGESTSSQGGFTTNAGVCGTANTRLFYRTYAGSLLYYTNWATISGTARTENPGNLVHGGNHGVPTTAGAYASAEDLSS